MKVETTPRINTPDTALSKFLRSIAQAVNAISEGRLAGSHNAQEEAPTTGTWTDGDFIRNKTPARGRYYGWIHIAGTWYGVGQIGSLRGNTAGRPNAAALGVHSNAAWTGYMYLDTTLDSDGKPIWRSNNAWVDATGAVV